MARQTWMLLLANPVAAAGSSQLADFGLKVDFLARESREISRATELISH